MTAVGERWNDASARYAAAAQPAFEAGRDAALRLAGLLISSTMGSRHMLDLPVRAAALEALQNADDLFSALAPTPQVGHFHFHLRRGLDELRTAFAAVDAELAGKAGVDPFPVLRAAWSHMEAASHALPGFETVDFKQSCCAWHQARLAENQGGFNGGLLDLDS